MLARVDVIVPNVACGCTFEFPQPVAGLPNSTLVRGIEHFRPELKLMPFVDAEFFDRRNIEVHLLWSRQVVARAVAEQRDNGVGENREWERLREPPPRKRILLARVPAPGP